MLKEYEGYLVSSFTVSTKTDLNLSKKLVSEVFTAAAQKFPHMTESEWPKEGATDSHAYELNQPSADGGHPSPRVLRIDPTKVGVQARGPLSYEEQTETIDSVVGIFDNFDLCAAFMLDLAVFRFVFEIPCNGNHHAAILRTLFPASAFAQVAHDSEVSPTKYQPEILLRCNEDDTLRYSIELRPRTSWREIQTGDFDNDEISVICGTAKLRGFAADEKLPALAERLKGMSREFVENAIVPHVVRPLCKRKEE